jgi:vitamin B12/bleomycin/antimicrobial peptide transport system ATP-binding/permease protein
MVGLGHLVEKLDDEDEAWDRTLSGGEQQRLAFARLFLHKPDIVVMDEATSALDNDSQTALMTSLAEHLPQTAIISVGHRKELEAFHERKVNLIRKEGGAKLVPGEIAAPAINVLGHLMKRFRTSPAASPVTPTAGTGMPRDPGSRDAA